MSIHKRNAETSKDTIMELCDGKLPLAPTQVVIGFGVISALLYIGEVLEKHLKEIASNTKRINNG